MNRPRAQIPDWMKMPVALQHQFFEQAAEAAAQCKQQLLQRNSRLEWLQPFIKTHSIPKNEEWRQWRVGVVDGSSTPSTSERLGGRYGVYSAGYMIFEGSQQVDEGYLSGRLVQDQTGDPEITQRVLAMLRTRLEREAAVHCLKEKAVDYVLIDGSFFGFRVDAQIIQEEELHLDQYPTGETLNNEVRHLTRELLASARVVGIIKRTRISALDGWIIYHTGDAQHCLNSNDKDVLAPLIPAGHWFAYQSLFGSPSAYRIFSRYRKQYDKYLARHTIADREYIRSRAEQRANQDEADSAHTARFYVKCSPQVPPFEFELNNLMPPEKFVAYFQAFHNPVTGLPWPLDLIDEQVSLPAGFLKEFVEEIEARLIRDHEVWDKASIAQVFSYLNPQKAED